MSQEVSTIIEMDFGALGILSPSMAANYQLSTTQAVFYKWFLEWVISGRMSWVEINKVRYYRLDYAYCARYLLMSVRSAKRITYVLCGTLPDNKTTPLKPPMVRYVDPIDHQVYFALDRSVLTSMIHWPALQPEYRLKLEHYMKMIPLIDVTPVPVDSRILSPVMEILDTLLAITIQENGKKKPMFSLTRPAPGKPATATMKKVQERLCQLYEGRFLSSNPLSDAFRDFAPTDALTGIEEVVHGVKKDWGAVQTLVIQAARRYRLWYHEDKQPISKKNLTRSLVDWLYNPIAMGGSSYFLRCCIIDPPPLTEFLAGKVQGTLPAAIQKSGESIFRDDMDSIAFWKRLQEVYDWGVLAKRVLNGRVKNIAMWFDGGIEDWFDRYCDWVWRPFGEKSVLTIGNLGTGNATWRHWVAFSLKKARMDHTELLNLSLDELWDEVEKPKSKIIS